MTSSMQLGFKMAQKSKSAKTGAVEALRLVSRFMAQLSDAEMEALLSGRAKLSLDFSRTETLSRSPAPEIAELQQIVALLDATESTSGAYEIFGRYDLSRSQLERMARSVDVAVRKEDTAIKLVEKLVEALVGSRLNSQAIRGTTDRTRG